MIDNLWITKVLGASIGSSIAIVFRGGGDPWLKLLQRLVIGTIIGVIFSPSVIRYLEWEETFENWLSASVLTGLVAYFVLHIVLSESTVDAVQQRLKK